MTDNKFPEKQAARTLNEHERRSVHDLDRERDSNLRSAFVQDWRDDFERSADRE